MEKIIRIPQIIGEVTNADLEDIPNETGILVSNLRSVNGKLEKTFGFGEAVSTAVASSTAIGFGISGAYPKWIGTYIHEDIAVEEMVPTLVTANWTLGSDGTGGWSAATGPARIIKTVSADTQTATPSVSFPVVAGKKYRVSITSSGVTGTITWTLGGVSGTDITGTTTTEQDITALTSGSLILSGVAGTAVTLTAISVKIMGHAKLAYYVRPADNVVFIYCWRGTSWAAIQPGVLLANAFDTYYHKIDNNPVIQSDGVIRFLPGNLGNVGANTCHGIWIGYIDRDFFDGNYLPAAYTAGFYNYSTTITKPGSILSAPTVRHGGSFNPTTPGTATEIHYKISYVYDGVQESLLSDPVSKVIQVSEVCSSIEMVITLTAASMCKRITSAKIYRCDTVDGDYRHVHTIDFLREAPTPVGSATGAYAGYARAYVPALTTFYFDVGIVYGMKLGRGDSTVDEGVMMGGYTGTGNTIFDFSTNCWDGFEYENAYWELWATDGAGNFVGSALLHEHSGAYAGDNCVIVGTDIGINSHVGGTLKVVTTTTTEIYEIISNYTYAIFTSHALSSTTIWTAGNFAWDIYDSSTGSYYLTYGAGAPLTYTFYDTKFTEGASHPYPNAVSLNMTGKYAKLSQGRLFLQNIVLDPGTSNEYHQDWIGYSESGSYDVLNVSNVFQCIDNTGGAGMGLALSYGSIIAMKPHSYFRIDLVDPADDSTWTIRESVFERGNVSPLGCVQVGHKFYPLSYDGIYEVDVNTLVSANEAPLINSRISEAINDQYLAITDANKTLILGGYDHIYNEILYRFTMGTYLAYNVVTKTWRQVYSSYDFTVFGYDQDGYLMGYDATNDKLYGRSGKQDTYANFRSKHFRISYDRNDIARMAKITYMSHNSLYVQMFVDGWFTTLTQYILDDTGLIILDDTGGAILADVGYGTLINATLPATSGAVNTVRVPLRRRCKSFVIGIVDVSANDDPVEIYDIELVTTTS
jgi:hypothetical protein